MKHALIFLAGLCYFSTISYAQNARFPVSGVIEFEKSVNMQAVIKKALKDNINSFYQEAADNYLKNNPQFKVLKSTLTFANGKTLFTPVADPESGRGFFTSAKQNNTIYTDFDAGKLTAQKTVYEETFLLKDSLRKITWKLTSEMRTIAGYECRRANGLTPDSVYVVAFYTDKIPVSGGPEFFSGLPGMILGIALPHENTTWFAKTVTDKPVTPNELKVPTKGKPVNNKTLRETINSALKDWGDYAQSALKAFLL